MPRFESANPLTRAEPTRGGHRVCAEMSKQDVCALIDSLWLSKPHRDGLRYKLQTRKFTAEELAAWGQQLTMAVDMQQDLVHEHAPSAVAAPEVEQLRGEPKKRRMLAGALLRQHIKDQSGLTVPADLSRQAVESYLKK